MKATKIFAVVMALASMYLAESNRVQVTVAEVADGTHAVLNKTYFLLIKNHILARGDRQTYCNRYNHNPHFQFREFDIYLNPDIGQQNINCDSKLSDFNEMVIRTKDSDYYNLTLGGEQNPGLVIRQYYRHVSPDTITKEVEKFFKNALKEIESKKDGQSKG